MAPADWSADTGARIQAGEYAPTAIAGGFHVHNRAQDLAGTLLADGLTIAAGSGDEIRLSLHAWGRESTLIPVSAVAPEQGPCLSSGAVDAVGLCLHRVDYARSGLTEWWENTSSGLEHGFVIDAAPPGSDPLVLDLAVGGAVVRVEHGSASLTGSAGEVLHYGHLVARDATGRELPSSIEGVAGGLRLVVDDRGAVGAIIVDPRLTGWAWLGEGTLTDEAFGTSVSTAGDVNGDGYDDVIIGAPGYSVPPSTAATAGAGAAFLYLGSAEGLSTVAAWSVFGPKGAAHLGSSVSTAGDVNGDGYADVILGCYGCEDGQTSEGEAFLYLGSAAGLSTTAATTLQSDLVKGLLGTSVGSAGDVNADGYDDVIVGEPGYANGEANEGRALLYLGSPAGLSATPGWAAEPDVANARLGARVASAGDVNGDGHDDVVVYASTYSVGQLGEGRVWVYLGNATGLDGQAAWTAGSTQASDYYGASVSSAGDVNGDHYDDLLVGARGYDASLVDAGRTYVYLGSATGLATAPAWSADGDQAGAGFGTSVTSVRDFNDDGCDDVVIGAPLWDSGAYTDAGAVFAYLGSSAGLATTASWSAGLKSTFNPNFNTTFGTAVGLAGDVDGDGYDDVLVGAPGRKVSLVREGTAYLILGGRNGAATRPSTGVASRPIATVELDQAAAAFGASVSASGDVNGDGFGDLIVGARGYDHGEMDEGGAFLYLGTAAGLSTTAAWSVESDQTGAGMGGAVSFAGDVNGDGFPDVIVGAPGASYGEAGEGRASLFLGSASGLATTAAWTTEVDQAGAGYGGSVATAGDVNGDGYSDVLVGASAYDDGAADAGRAFLYLGSPSGLSAVAAWTTSLGQAGAGLGGVVAAAGDVDGDGYGDVLVGASGYDDTHADQGRVMLFAGSASGLSPVAAWTAGVSQAGAAFGAALAGAGDVNGDGFADVVVGAPGYDEGSSAEGGAFLYVGSATGLAVDPAWHTASHQAGASWGGSVATAGDVDGDGYADVLVGARGYSNGSAGEGRAALFLGGEIGLSPTPAWTAEPNQAGAAFGSVVASAGDVNGDGLGDVVVSAPAPDGGQLDEGRLFLYLGETGMLDALPQWDIRSGWRNSTLASAGDVNGDGYDDVVAGFYDYSHGQIEEGAAYVYLGSAAGLSTVPAWQAESNQGDAFFGFVVAGAGDVNGDGYEDVLVGAPGYANGQFGEGAAYLYLGSGAGLSTTPAWTAESDQIAAQMGWSLAGAGDVNGDGYADVVVSAIRYYSGGSQSGRVYVYLGTPSGLSPTPWWTYDSPGTPDGFGWLVSSAGDMNGDGYDEIAVSEPWYIDAGTGGGRVHVFRGGPTPAGVPSWTLECGTVRAGFGSSVGSAGDVNGDGFGDLIIGAPEYDDGQSQGATFVWFGSANGPSPSASSQDRIDRSLGGLPAGDVNADGYGDVAIGPAGEDAIAIYLGSPSGLRREVAWMVYGEEYLSVPGAPYESHTLASGGDINGDGYADLLVDGTGIEGGLAFRRAVAYVGHSVHGAGLGLSFAPQARQPGLTTPIAPEGASTSTSAFDVAMRTRAAAGRQPTRLEVEVKPAAVPFDGKGLVVSPWQSDAAASAFVQQSLTGLDVATAYHWRARVGLSLLGGTSQAWGPWKYGGLTGGARASHTRTAGYFWYLDADGDGYGDSTILIVGGAEPPPGSVADATDCDDQSATTHPDAPEQCNGVDDNCVDGVDEGLPILTQYVDADGDGYGDPSHMAEMCGPVAGFATNATDCDDAASNVHPGAPELCNGFDDNCVSGVDEGVLSTFYADADLDGFGDPSTALELCDLQLGYSADSTDCDDHTATVHPGATEVCNGVDDNCVNGIDEGTLLTFYADADNDGFGDPALPMQACSAPAGTVANRGDCDDNDASTHPGAPDTPRDGVDADCDGDDGTLPGAGDTDDTDPGDSDSPGESDNGGTHDDTTTGSPGCACGTAGGVEVLPMMAALFVVAVRRRRGGASAAWSR